MAGKGEIGPPFQDPNITNRKHIQLEIHEGILIYLFPIHLATHKLYLYIIIYLTILPRI